MQTGNLKYQVYEQFFKGFIFNTSGGSIEKPLKSAVEYGKIRADLENKVEPIGVYDLLIAAHALSENLTLITNLDGLHTYIPSALILTDLANQQCSWWNN